MAVRRNCRERIVVILSPGETRKHAPLHLGGAQAVCEVRSKNGPWTDLEKDTMPLTDKLGDCVREAHGVAHIAPPIFGAEHFGFNYVARYRRHQPHLRRARSKTAKIRQEVLAEAVHCSRVEGEIQIKRAAPMSRCCNSASRRWISSMEPEIVTERAALTAAISAELFNSARMSRVVSCVSATAIIRPAPCVCC